MSDWATFHTNKVPVRIRKTEIVSYRTSLHHEGGKTALFSSDMQRHFVDETFEEVTRILDPEIEYGGPR